MKKRKKLIVDPIANYYKKLFTICKRKWTQSSPIRAEVLLLARSKVNGLDKWLCACCNNKFAYSEIDVDHKDPVGSTIPKNLKEFLVLLERQNSSKENLRVICKKICHRLKTKEDSIKKKRDEKILFIHNNFQSFIGIYNLSELKLDELFKLVKKLIRDDTERKTEKTKEKLEKFVKRFL